MSKCNLEIVFDRPGRVYRPGEEVTGSVSVVVNQDLECNGLLLQHFWQTHGRGNSTSGPKQELVLDRGNWRAGDTFNHRFRLDAPEGPPTYHGHYLNIDHYVGVRVDIPWARDVIVQEDYLLLPGDAAYGHLPPSPGGKQPAAQGFAKVSVPLGAALVIAGVIFLCPLGIILIPLGALLLFSGLRKSMAESKMGKITVDWGCLEVAPGGSVHLRFAFTPRKFTRVNGVAARLTGVERCVSGSGTNKKTHTHKLHEETVVLLPASGLIAGRRVQLEGTIAIPQTNAFSFTAPDNEVIWTVELRVDIPSWPDWVEKRVLSVRPALEPSRGEPAGMPPAETPERETQAASPFAAEGPSKEEKRPADEGPLDSAWRQDRAVEAAGLQSPRAEDSGEAALQDIVARLAAARPYGPERERIIDEVRGRSFRCTVTVDRVDRTIGYGTGERFRNGRTVIGVLSDTDCAVAVQLSEAWNDRVDSLAAGSRLAADCRLVKWNNIYARLDLEEA